MTRLRPSTSEASSSLRSRCASASASPSNSAVCGRATLRASSPRLAVWASTTLARATALHANCTRRRLVVVVAAAVAAAVVLRRGLISVLAGAYLGANCSYVTVSMYAATFAKFDEPSRVDHVYGWPCEHTAMNLCLGSLGYHLYVSHALRVVRKQTGEGGVGPPKNMLPQETLHEGAPTDHFCSREYPCACLRPPCHVSR